MGSPPVVAERDSVKSEVESWARWFLFSLVLSTRNASWKLPIVVALEVLEPADPRRSWYTVGGPSEE